MRFIVGMNLFIACLAMMGVSTITIGLNGGNLEGEEIAKARKET